MEINSIRRLDLLYHPHHHGDDRVHSKSRHDGGDGDDRGQKTPLSMERQILRCPQEVYLRG